MAWNLSTYLDNIWVFHNYHDVTDVSIKGFVEAQKCKLQWSLTK